MKPTSFAQCNASFLTGALLLLAGAYSAFTQTSTTDFQVTITTPANGASFTAPANIPIVASVFDASNDVAYVVFMATPGGGGIKPPYELFLGTVSNSLPLGMPGSLNSFYTLTWTNPQVGTWSLSADAVRSNGVDALSPPVTITVGSNFPPVVRITSPPDNSVFRAPVDITLLAYATEPGGYVSTVQFFAGSNSLGFGQPLAPSGAAPLGGTPGPVGPPIFLTNIFELIWSNAPPGIYALTAVATGNTGASATSDPVHISILPLPPPPTNKPAIVSIVATDPIAIAGTNCWPWLGLASATPTWSNWVSPTAVCGWFTNCGPKDATFAIRRFGDTNDDLTVDYSIGGTASNGVDYLALPGVATIPSGQVATLITIIPTGDPTNNAILTVILSLDPSTNSPPDYLPGFPRRAEALILDNMSARPVASTLTDHSFLMSAQGPDGAWFRVDYTTDGLTWTPVCTNQVVVGSISFADPDAATSTTRWYRAVPLPIPPSN